jgi:hypothetical protein
MRSIIADLTPTIEASGPHDFAVRKLALSSAAHSRPSHPNPTFVTIAKRPSVLGRDDESCRCDLGQKRTAYFCKQDWTTQITLIRHKKLDPGRKAVGPNADMEQRFRICVCDTRQWETSMLAAIDRVIETFTIIANLNSDEEQTARERVSRYLAGKPDTDEHALAVEGLRYLRSVRKQEQS